MTSFEFATESLQESIPQMQGVPNYDHPGDPKGTDTVPAWLTPGEFVMNAEATRMFPEQIESMNDAGRAMQAQQGGTIPEYAADGGMMKGLASMFSNMTLPTPPDGIQYKRMKDGSIGMWAGNTYRGKYQEPKQKKQDRNTFDFTSLYKSTGGPAWLTDDLLDSLMQVESGGDVNAVSKAGAIGPYQIMPATAASPGYNTDPISPEDMRDPIKSRNFARQYLTGLANHHKDFTQDEVLQAYNFGPGNVQKVKSGERTDVPKEAQDYVGKIKSMLAQLNPISTAHADSTLSNSRQSAVPMSVAPPKPDARDQRVAKLNEAAGPNMTNRNASQGGASFADMGVTIPGVPPVTRPVTPMSLIPEEDLLADQQLIRKLQAQTASGIPYESASDVGDPFPSEPPPVPVVDQQMLDAQAAMARDGVYNSGDNDMAGLGSDTPENAARARQLEADRMQANEFASVPKPPSLAVDPGLAAAVETKTNAEDTRSEFRKFGDAGGLMGMAERGLETFNENAPEIIDKINQVKEKFQQENIEQNKRNKTLLEEDRMQQGQVDYKESGEYGVHDTIVRTDDNGVNRTYTWNEEKNDYVDDNGLAYTRNFGELIKTGFFSKKPSQDKGLASEPAGGDKHIGTLDGDKVYMGADGNPYVIKPAMPGGVDMRMGIMPYDTDNIKLLPKNKQTVVEKKDVPPMDASGMIPNPDAKRVDGKQPTTKTTSKETATAKQNEKSTVLKTIIADEKAKADGPASGKPPPKTPANPDGDGEKTPFFDTIKDLFGGLFDKKELARMAVMYGASRAMGYSHEGSLGWAGQQYIKRIDTKEANLNASAQKLLEQGEYTPKSIAAYKKSGDASVLIKKAAAAIDQGVTERWYSPDGKRVMAKKYKVGDAIVWSADGGKTKLPNDYHQLHSTVKNQPEYNKRIATESKVLVDAIKEMGTTSGDVVKGDSKNNIKPSQSTNIQPQIAASEVARWAAMNNLDVATVTAYTQQAYQQAVADAQAEDSTVKPSSLIPYLNALKIRQDTMVPELFNLYDDDDKLILDKNGKPQMMDSVKVHSITRQYLDIRGATGMVSEGSNKALVNNFWTVASTKFAEKVRADATVYDTYKSMAGPNETPFYVYCKEQLGLLQPQP